MILEEVVFSCDHVSKLGLATTHICKLASLGIFCCRGDPCCLHKLCLSSVVPVLQAQLAQLHREPVVPDHVLFAFACRDHKVNLLENATALLGGFLGTVALSVSPGLVERKRGRKREVMHEEVVLFSCEHVSNKLSLSTTHISKLAPR